MATYTTMEEEQKEVQKDGQQIADSTASGLKTDYTDYVSQYNQAMDKLGQLKQNLPTYDASYDQSLQQLFDEIMNYEKFSYNSRDDMLYQAYKQSYTNAGRLAMEDTMGQAASLTGGYGSSYSQSVGGQQYDAYLQKLNDVLPETYGMAYQQYLDEKSGLQDRYTITGQLAEDEYEKYQDRLSNYYQELGYWQDAADTAYDRQQYADEQAYQRQQDAYDRLAEMITVLGYKPTDEELSAAGMSKEQYKAYKNYYNKMNVVSSSSGSGSKKKDAEDNSAYTKILNVTKNLIDKGMDIEALNGAISSSVVANGLSVEETRKIMEELTGYAINNGKL